MEQRNNIFPSSLSMSVAIAAGTLIILLAAAGLAGAIILRVPDSVTATFQLLPPAGADPVHATMDGVLTDIRVHETKDVRAGDELFTIQSREIRQWTTELLTLNEEMESIERRAKLAEEDYRTQLEIQNAKIQQHEKEAVYQKEYLATYQDFLKRIEKLGAEGLVSTVDLISHRLGAARAERDLAQIRQTIELATLEVRKIENSRSTTANQLEGEKVKLVVKMRSLKRQVQGLGEDVIHIRAPFDGTVLSVEKKTVGDVVSLGQELCRLARTDAGLVAQLSLPEEAASRVRSGLPVQLFFEAFPYQRFGTGKGELIWISPAATETNEGQRFLARARPDPGSLTIRGNPKPLKAGMRGEARIRVGYRTPIEYFFEPIKQLRENWQ
ncbi:MAG: HlyD family efflux transporter periplasmic adaptor subunit [Acidobacteria bacterium]|nr:MAG: HlyD family efflux transporter periplasmic adaptor subunit [Acidobacteriota bacterium]